MNLGIDKSENIALKTLLEGAIITFQRKEDGTYINNDNEKGKIEERDGIKVMVYFDKTKYNPKEYTPKIKY